MLRESSALRLQVILIVTCSHRLVTALCAVDSLAAEDGHGDTTGCLCMVLEIRTLAAGTVKPLRGTDLPGR